MRFNSLRRVAGSAALMIAAGLLLSAPAPAQYRDYDRDARYGQYGYQGRWSRDQMRDYAFKLGYHTGYSDSGTAMEQGYARSVRDVPSYRDDNNGFLSWMGNERDYRSAYRRGFEQAFQDIRNRRPRRYNRQDVERALGGNLKDIYGQDRYDRSGWGNDRDWRDWGRNRDRDGRWDRDRDGRWDRNEVNRLAQQNGYREGLRQGQDDAARRRNFNYEDDSRYRDALSGYQSRYGDRDDYRRAFREGYRQGYEEGYRNRRF